jgi:hypothetical protein
MKEVKDFLVHYLSPRNCLICLPREFPVHHSTNIEEKLVCDLHVALVSRKLLDTSQLEMTVSHLQWWRVKEESVNNVASSYQGPALKKWSTLTTIV